MGKIPEKINSLGRYMMVSIDLDSSRNIYYRINKGEGTGTTIHVKLPEYFRPTKSEEIVDSNDHFANGFKVVQTANGEYAYVRQSDNVLLPFRYDVAFDFNEFGFAMVGKDGTVSWINKDFNHLNAQGKMVEEVNECWTKFDGWQEVGAFSKGDVSLSRLYDGRETNARVAYLGVDGKLKEFHCYNGEMGDQVSTVFSCGSVFGENGRAEATGKLLFAKGYYIPYAVFVDLCEQKGFVDLISAEAEKCFDPETGKLLEKKLK